MESVRSLIHAPYDTSPKKSPKKKSVSRCHWRHLILGAVEKVSAGLLMYRFQNEQLEVLLVHPGGPFWKNKDAGAWTIPKGELQEGEEPLLAARREFEEELGIAPAGEFVELTAVRQKGGKVVRAWAFEGDCEPTAAASNTFTIEWPPRSGRMATFPEIDQAEFFNLGQAKVKINAAQASLLEELRAKVASRR
jgi:predicted NUDIX family NTP pyrophosphohydrolase